MTGFQDIRTTSNIGPYDPFNRGYSALSSPSSGAHLCNCIGCCRDCGQCRTTGTHAKTCKQIAALNKERDRILADARVPSTRPVNPC